MDKLLTVGQVANRLGRSAWSIYEDIKDGIIPARRLKPRGRIYIVEDELREALKPISVQTALDIVRASGASEAASV